MMKAKRQILSLLLALIMVWQGFSFAHAAGSGSTGASVVTVTSGAGRTEAASSSTLSAQGGAGAQSGASAASTSASGPQEIKDGLKNVELLLNGQPITNGTVIPNYKLLQFKATIAVKDKNIHSGDYITIQLPKELKSDNATIDIKGEGGVSLATGIYDAGTRVMKIVFNEHAENYSGADGSVFFNVAINTEVQKESKQSKLEVAVNGVTVLSQDIKYEVVIKENAPSFWKSSDPTLKYVVDSEGNTHALIHYIITMDARKIKRTAGATSLENVVFTDTLASPALSYFDVKNHLTKLSVSQAVANDYAPVARKGKWRSGEDVNGVWVNAATDEEPNRGKNWSLRNANDETKTSEVLNNFVPNYSADRRSFTFNIGHMDLTDGYIISYYVEINEAAVNGTKYYNKAKLTGVNVEEKEQERQFLVQEAGGSLSGTSFKIQVHKKGDDGEFLQGAKFELKNTKNGYTKTAVSDENGIADFTNVLKSDYTLTEVQAPEGYELDSTPIPISSADIAASIANNATVSKEVINKKDTPKFRNISVKKEWVLDLSLAATKPEKVSVSVLKNGVKDENLKVELSAANGWKASFSNLPTKDANGNPIQYSVAEDEISGFNPAISGTADYGFTISNYNGGRVVIPVTKIWRGNGTHPSTLNVQLFANGEKVSTYTLSKDNGWQHQFDMPKYDQNGKEIRYTLTEDSVPGYTASTENDGSTGYTNVFINTKNTPNHGGTTPGNPGGGGSQPRVPSQPNTPPTKPGEVLPANRETTAQSSPVEVTKEEGAVLGADRDQAAKNPSGEVLGAKRGKTKTDDTSSAPLHFLLFTMAGLGFCTTLLLEKRRKKSNR